MIINIYCNSNLIEFVCNPVGKIKLSLSLYLYNTMMYIIM